jgi:hypothetical protein
MRTLPWRPLLAILAVALTVPVASQAADAPTGLKAEYFANETLSGTPAAERIDPTVDFAWESVEPAPGVGEHGFSARWSGTITPRYTERYTLTTRTDDGVRLWIDGKLVIDDWARHAVKANTVELDLVADQAHELRMEFYEHLGRAEARLLWESASQAREIVPTERLAPVATTIPPAVDTKTDEPATETLKDVVEKAADVLPIIQVTGTVPTEAARLLPPPEAPVAGEQFNAEPLAGEVLVRRPEDGVLIPLEAGASLPVGTRIDARDGAVALQTAPAEGFDRPTQDAAFEGAMFKVTQPARGKRIVGIDLAHGDFESCKESTRGSRARARAAAAGKRDKQVRRVFGKGKGKFRTKGRFAAATVRGTAWTVADTCDSTITRVHEGVVDVENLVTGRKVVVEAGERYVAKAR